jgi:hypothetical protein
MKSEIKDLKSENRNLNSKVGNLEIKITEMKSEMKNMMNVWKDDRRRRNQLCGRMLLDQGRKSVTEKGIPLEMERIVSECHLSTHAVFLLLNGGSIRHEGNHAAHSGYPEEIAEAITSMQSKERPFMHEIFVFVYGRSPDEYVYTEEM